MSALDLFAGRYWPIEYNALQNMVDIATLNERVKAGLEREPDWAQVEIRCGLEPGTLTSRRGEDDRGPNPEPGTEPYHTRQGEIAIHALQGPLFPKANLMTRHSGATSTEKWTSELRALADDENVKGIMLNVDSPGGNVNGISAAVYAVRDAAQKKPVWAYTSAVNASAAYWISSAAETLVADRTALIGSIGVQTTVIDDREANQNNGIKTIRVVSKNAPRKNAEPWTPEGHEETMNRINELEAVMIGDIAKNRRVSQRKVKSDFGRGGILVGRQAQSAGMVDALMSFDDALHLLSVAAGAVLF